MTLGLANEVAEEGIRVNAVRPGIIHTGLHALGGEPGRVDLHGSILRVLRLTGGLRSVSNDGWRWKRLLTRRT